MRIGKSTSYAIDTHAALKTGIHEVGTSYLAKTSVAAQTLSDTEIPAAIARDAEVILQSLLTTRGDIVFRGASVAERLAKGSANQALLMGANDPAWGDVILQSLLTTRGDIIFRGASVAERLAKGSAGQALLMGANDPAWATIGLIPSGLIALWHGSIDNIPTGWVICDGNNSTPNLLAKFVQGVATAATNPGTTGGATAKTTGAPSATVGVQEYASGTPKYLGSDTHTHTISDIRPLFYDVAFIMKT